MSAADRKAILGEAIRCVTKDRNATHGEAEDNFKNIARYWTIHLQARGLLPRDKEVSREDVAIMSGLIKVARLAQSPGNRDNWVDLAGYAACGGGCAAEKPTQFNAPPLCSACHKLHHVGQSCEARALSESLRVALSCPTCGHLGRECMCKKSCDCGCLACAKCYPDAT